MKKSIQLIILFIGASLILQSSCTNSAASIHTGATVIQGTIKNAGTLSLYFDKINFDNTNFMFPNTPIDGDGNFKMVIEDPVESGIYRIRIGKVRSYMVLDGTEKNITINGDLSTFNRFDFEVKGLKTGQAFHDHMRGFHTGKMDSKKMEEYINEEDNSIAAAFAVTKVFGNAPEKMELIKSVNEKLKSDLPDSKYSKDFGMVVEQLQLQMAQAIAKKSIKLGLPAPEIQLKDPNGKEYKLSDLKGKIVLLDFWASWCGPCRKANPHVVDVYKRYKDQGFTVMSVSLDGINPRMMNRFKTQEEIDKQLDSARKRWEAAIEKDELIWDYHVSDLKHWNSIAAKTYNVTSIPKTFLIDRDGNFAAMNPRMTLEEELKKLL